MSNNKQSSIELFIEQLEEKGGAWENVSIRRLNISIDVSDYMELKQQVKAMHKEEIEKAFYQGADDESNEHGIMYLDMNEAETYYTKTFGGNNEQQ